jgi:hypothetical protein
VNENLLLSFPNLVILTPTLSEGLPRLGLVQDSCNEARSCGRRDKDARPQQKQEEQTACRWIPRGLGTPDSTSECKADMLRHMPLHDMSAREKLV